MNQTYYINNANNINKSDKKVWLALSPDYANIGDIAISIAQQTILKEVFPDRKIIEIPMLDYFKYKKQMCNLINYEDIITIIGGGNIGNIYLEGEERRRDLISTFQNNAIISFPQSIDFSNDYVGIQEFKKTIDIYSKNPNLTVFSRENKSFNIMKNNFTNSIKHVPDTVMYLTGKLEINNLENRDRILICFRNDREKVTTKAITYEFINLLMNHDYKDIELIDTYLGKIEFSPENKNILFKKLLNKFEKSKLVITDRLHGMIFSLITKTPCIAFDNSNKKISSTYNTWLNNVPYIKLLDDFDELEILNDINKFAKLDTSTININMDNYFEPLFQELKKYRT